MRRKTGGLTMLDALARNHDSWLLLYPHLSRHVLYRYSAFTVSLQIQAESTTEAPRSLRKWEYGCNVLPIHGPKLA